MSQRNWLRRQVLRLVGINQGTQTGGADRVRGPLMVQRNLLAGLAQSGQPFRLNPPTFRVTPWVGVLSHPSALYWAVRAKRRGKIKRLLAGPNLVVTPLEADGILCAPEIDLVVTPSRWVSEWYVSLAPQLTGKVAEWPVGIDTDTWVPAAAVSPDERHNWLIYDKTAQGGQLERDAVMAALRDRNESYTVIVYGDYAQKAYWQALKRAKAMIVLSPSESQGIAQFEAWSCDVPTLVWDRGRIEWQDLVFDAPSASSSPYLSDQCGLRFANTQDLPLRLEEFIACLGDYTPRDYVLNHFTLRHSAIAYLNLMASS